MSYPRYAYKHVQILLIISVHVYYPQEKPYVAICLEALKALHKFLETLLLSEENPKISLAAIQNFAVDITRCESKCMYAVYTYK